MAQNQPRRNDPCPCGSGKLYKHCCKPSRREAFKEQREVALARATPLDIDRGEGWPLADVRTQLRRNKLLPHDKKRELEKLLELAEEAATYEAMRPQINAASQVLEAHRAEFDALRQNEEQALERLQQLLTEEPFQPLRFTLDEVRDAFKTLGYPPRQFKRAEEPGAVIESVIGSLADEQRRRHLAIRLDLLLPRYVAEGRYLDAWLLQTSAYLVVEEMDKSFAFLYQMFEPAFQQWLTEMNAGSASILRALGLDPDQIRDMDPTELGALMSAQMSDPAAIARAEAVMAAHPELAEEAARDARKIERSSWLLLDREDAAHLFPVPEEVSPWLPEILARVAAHSQRPLAALTPEDLKDPELGEAARIALAEIAQAMAPALWTPERRARHRVELGEYAKKLQDAGETKAASLALAAQLSLSRDNPEDSMWLIGLNLAALYQLIYDQAEDDS